MGPSPMFNIWIYSDLFSNVMGLSYYVFCYIIQCTYIRGPYCGTL